MSKRQYGTLHSMNPSWKEDPDDLVSAVVNVYRHGGSMLDLARELWRLTDNDQRAKQIDEVLAVAYAREPVILETQGIEQLLALLDGLDDAVRKAVLGPMTSSPRTACPRCGRARAWSTSTRIAEAPPGTVWRKRLPRSGG